LIEVMTQQTLSAEQPKIGQLVRDLRQLLGLTQEKFAAKLGVAFPTINRWENNKATPSPMALRLIEAEAGKLGEPGRKLLERYFSRYS
jgi:transcriptional regulator with XRE-family HTH domain